VPYNEIIATTLIGLLVIAVSCLLILAYLLLTKQVRSPQEVLSAAREGNTLARVYIGLFVLAFLVFVVQIVVLIFRGR
jgi:hypothetical protein